jgi:methionyl-tRNA formyltransferase
MVAPPVTPLRVVFFGTPAFAVPSLDSLAASAHSVCGVVTQPDRPSGRGQKLAPPPVKARALELHAPVLQPATCKDASFIDAVRTWAPDIGVVAAYGQILPQALLDVPRLGMINVHASLLPRYRGASPIHRAVMAGDAVTGVTIMRVVRALDAGPAFSSVERPIGPDETTEDVETDLARLGARLLVDVLERIATGTARETPQDDAAATYAPRLTRDDGLVDWARPARALHDQVRGLHPWPHAHTTLEGRRVVLLTTRVDPPAAPTASSLVSSVPPGTVVEAAADRLIVVTGSDGRLALERLQLDGRRPATAREFLAGQRLAPGARFGGK